MAGTGLVDNGDVQLGTDANYLVGKIVDAVAGTTVTRVTGFNPWAQPDLLTEDVTSWHRPGVRPGADVAGARTVQFNVTIRRPSAATLATAMSTLSATCQPILTAGVEQELAFRYNGVNYVLYGRYRTMEPVDTETLGLHQVTMRIKFVATDPIIYETQVRTLGLQTYTTELSSWHVDPAAMVATVRSSLNPPHFDIGGSAPPRYIVYVLGPARNAVFMDVDVNLGYTSWLWMARPGGAVIPDGFNWNIMSAARRIQTPGGDATDAHAYRSMWPVLQPSNVSTTLRLCLALNNSFSGSAVMPSGSIKASTIQWQRGWWTLP